MFDPSTYPLLAARADTPFMRDLLAPPMNVNGHPMSRATWNLIMTKRDLSMWTQFRTKPHRRWQVSQVKAYFGIKGTGQTLLDRFLALQDETNRMIADYSAPLGMEQP